MSTKDTILRSNGAEWDTVLFACPKCGSFDMRLHMIDDEQHFVLACKDDYKCGWNSERYTHLPSDAEAPEWPFEPVVDDIQTVEVLVPIDDDGDIIAEVDDFRGKDCDVVLPEVAKSLGEIKEER